MKIRNADYWRDYRAKRQEAGNPCDSGTSGFERVERTFGGWSFADDSGVLTEISGFGDGVPGIHLGNPQGIGTKDALDFLISNAGIATHHAMYGSGYAITLVLLTLSNERCGIMPLDPEATGKDFISYLIRNETPHPLRVLLDGTLYALKYMPGKSFFVGRFRDARKRFVVGEDGKKHPDYDGSIRIWDLYAYFRNSIAFACDKLKIEPSCERAETIARVFEKIVGHYHAAKIRPRDWHGPGAASMKLMQDNKVKTHIAPAPPHLEDPLARAYFGGRAELMRAGHGGTVYAHDMASAYAWATSELPSLHGEWKPGDDGGAFTLHHVRYAFREGAPWYPLPYRTALGTIVFSPTGEGWHHGSELAAAQAWRERYGGTLEVLESWSYAPYDLSVLPFAWVRDLYARRRAYARRGNPAAWALKTVLQAIYGKLAQRQGAAPYYSQLWAGMVTARVRAQCVFAGLSCPESVVAVATDAVYADRPLPCASGPEDAELGAWRGPTRHHDSVWAQAGISWLGDESNDWKARCSGFDRAHTAHPSLALDAWRKKVDHVDIPATRFVSFASALADGALWPERGKTRTIARRLMLDGRSVKRYPLNVASWDLCGGSVATVPRENEWYESTGDCSYPYAEIIQPELIDGVPTEIFLGEMTG